LRATVAWWRRLTASRRGLLVLLIGLGVLDYAAAKGLRALRDRRPAIGVTGPAATNAVLSPDSPVTLPVPGTAPGSAGVVAVGPAGRERPGGAGRSERAHPGRSVRPPRLGQPGAAGPRRQPRRPRRPLPGRTAVRGRLAGLHLHGSPGRAPALRRQRRRPVEE